MQSIAAGDPGALELLYDRYSTLTFSLCCRILHDRNEAEDLLTDIFYEIWAKADRYDPARGSPLTYLMTLTRSRAIDRQRAGKKFQAQHPGDDLLATGSRPDGTIAEPSPLDGALGQERRQQVQKALCALDPPQRLCVELSFFDNLSHSEIAQKLNKPLGTVKTYIRQGLIRLRDGLRTD
jgi:RNA polymerase sigma-70 factor (ECF subfamily)